MKPPLAALPARDAPVIPLDIMTWPPDREPDFPAWCQYAGGSALVGWVRDRQVNPVPHVVYVLQLATDPPAWYVGITKDLDQRMAKHGRSARRVLEATPAAQAATLVARLVAGLPAEDNRLRAYQLDANEAWIHRHGLAHVDDRQRAVPAYMVEVPDEVVALLVEVVVSCTIRAHGYDVFGRSTDAICPAAAWLPKKATWDRNELRPRGGMIYMERPLLPPDDVPSLAELVGAAEGV